MPFTIESSTGKLVQYIRQGPRINSNLDLPEKYDFEFLETVKKELEELKPIIINLINKILEEKPDIIYFLGKSSHIFRKPFAMYFKSLGINTKIDTFNDNRLKGLYLKGELNKQDIDFNLGNLAGKKVFFIDETFSDGKGAATILEIKKLLDYNLSYFSLSYDPNSRINKDEDFKKKDKREKMKIMLESGQVVDLNVLTSLVGIQNFPIDIQNYEEHIKNIEEIRKSKNFSILNC